MLTLTKVSGKKFLINPDKITFVEECGDTRVSLDTGENILVQESAENIQKYFVHYKQSTNGQVPQKK